MVHVQGTKSKDQNKFPGSKPDIKDSVFKILGSGFKVHDRRFKTKDKRSRSKV